MESDFGFHHQTHQQGKEIRQPYPQDSGTSLSSLATWDLMEDTRASIMQGTDFGNLAAQLSDDKESAQNQGIIGDLTKTACRSSSACHLRHKD